MSLYFTTNDYCTNAAMTAFMQYRRWTVSAWVHMDTAASGSGVYCTLWGMDKAGATDYCHCQIYTGDSIPTNSFVRVTFYDGATTVQLYENISILSDEWHHIAVRVDEGAVYQNYVGLYIDGVLTDTDTTDLDFADNLSRIHVGCRRSGLSRYDYMEGWIADVGCYSYTSAVSDFTWITNKPASGWSCHNVRPDILYAYWPLRSSALWGAVDMHSTFDLTATGPTWAEDEHPAIRYPRLISGG